MGPMNSGGMSLTSLDLASWVPQKSEVTQPKVPSARALHDKREGQADVRKSPQVHLTQLLLNGFLGNRRFC